MTDLEIYTLWATAYDTANTRQIIGMLSPDECDRSIRNMEERLGVNTWTVERWQAAYDAWRADRAGEGA